MFRPTLPILLSLALAASPAALPSLAEPSLAPDRAEVVFVSGGDIWSAPLSGGEARLLVSHPATESRPLYSPDGKRLAFMSTRSGNPDIYVLDLGASQTRRITFDDAAEHLDAWSRDGKWLYFSSTSHDIAGNNDLFRVSAEGGTPMPVSDDRYTGEYWAAPSPDGNALAFTARGMPAAQWWRRGHSHIDESEIWLLRTPGSHPRVYDRVSGGAGSKEEWPMWSADGKRLYFVSDRDGTENLYAKDLGAGQPRKLTKFTAGRLLWPSIAYDGKTIVFERDFSIWKFDVRTSEASRIDIALRGAPAGPEFQHLSLSNQFRDLALSADGKKVAFVAHGDVFAAGAKDGGTAARVTSTAANDFEPHWAPDSNRVCYVSDRDGVYHLYEYDFAKNTEARLTASTEGEWSPQWSPDGKMLAFVRGGRKLIVWDKASRQERELVQGYFGRPPSGAVIEWAADSKWLAYIGSTTRQFRNVFVVPAAGGSPQAVSFVPNTFVNSLAWSPDGTYLLFGTGQRTEPAAVVRVDLIPKTPKFREDQFRELFKDELPSTPPSTTAPAKPAPETPAPAKPRTPPKVDIVFEGIRGRYRALPVGMDAARIKISPDGKTLLFTASAAGQLNLYTYSLDELAKDPPVARQLTSTPGIKSDAHWSPDSKEVYYLETGRLQSITVETRVVKPVAITADMDIDFEHEKMEVFAQAWKYVNDNFYDPEFHGANWKQLRSTFEPYIAGARTGDEVRRVISLMLGELNASHSGISAGGPNPPVTGKLGLRFDPAEYAASSRLRIADVIPLSPAAIAGIQPRSFVLAVDGVAIDPHTNFDELLNYKVDRRVTLTVANSGEGDGKRDFVMRPVNTSTEKQLLYRQWVEGRREYVHKISGGRLGYVHMPDMSSDALQGLYFDLDTENQSRDGVVIDIRSNNGGFVNAYALDVLARRPYLNMTPRDQPTAPARTLLGQRSLERPTILVTNQESLSDAEDFTEGYRSMKLGKVVGEPTAGWIVYTSGVQLIDGSMLRLPSTKITTNEGVNMERNPRPVDIRVDRPVGESYTGHDSQLDAAVKELLAEIGK